VRASGGGRRAGQRQLTPLVGRNEEIGMLMRRWERARQGDGQLVTIVGEPGLGKSRLIEEFHTVLRDVPHTWVEWSCSQLLQNTPLADGIEIAGFLFNLRYLPTAHHIVVGGDARKARSFNALCLFARNPRRARVSEIRRRSALAPRSMALPMS
jgi:hypothetical protein